MAAVMPRRPSRMARFRRSETGATAVEFAIVVTPVLMILIGIMDFSLVAWRASSLDHAASQLHSAVRQNLTDSGDYRRFFCDAAGNLVDCGPDSLRVRVEPLASISTGALSDGYSVTNDDPFVVQTSYRHDFLTPFMANIMAENVVQTRLVIYGARD